ETYSVRRPARAQRAATSSSRVDLPTPGSPAINITAPETTPPPSTRSSSGRPEPTAATSVAATWAMGTAGLDTGAAAVRPVRELPPATSTVPHDWHSPHRPTHLPVVQPRSVQAKADAVLGGTRFSLGGGTDRLRSRGLDTRLAALVGYSTDGGGVVVSIRA